MHILFKLACRSRTKRLFRTLDNIINNCSNDNFHILISLDYDDTAIVNKTILGELQTYLDTGLVSYHLSNNKTKIQAINANMEHSGKWDILVNVSDDIIFTKKGFDIDIRDAFHYLHKNVPAKFIDLDQFIHFPEPQTMDKLCIMSIMGRTYYERFNYIYHPSYISLWCDNEATEVAQMLGKYIYVNTAIFTHAHAAWGLAEKDELLKRNESYFRRDKMNYLKRKAKNFDLSKEITQLI